MLESYASKAFYFQDCYVWNQVNMTIIRVDQYFLGGEVSDLDLTYEVPHCQGISAMISGDLPSLFSKR